MPLSVRAAVENGWEETDGNKYWYENGVKQGLEGRGKEIYDPGSNAWYWLDSVDGGKMAVSKDVYQDSEAGEYADREDGTGKWCRYDAWGHMIKGWDVNAQGTYYFDPFYGAMVKGEKAIDGVNYIFNRETGVMESCSISMDNHWETVDGREYWYEGGVRQGYDVNDPAYRGKEIYDPGSDAWYWLDNVQQGAKAVSKDVYQESQADDAGNIGKWVRYDESGHMIKGWNEQDGNRYYFDLVYGTTAKGKVAIDGKTYQFNEETGVCEGEAGSDEPEVTPSPAPDEPEETPAPSPVPDATPTPVPDEPDAGGATVRVYGTVWSSLDEDRKNADPDAYALARERAEVLEKKYNIKLEYVELDGDYGYDTANLIIMSLVSGNSFADIMTVDQNTMIVLANDYLADITDTCDSLKIGSSYLEPATWKGHVYGFSADNIGDVPVLAYSRDYLKALGMELTPADMFMAGKWSYDDAAEYFEELQSYLPKNQYAIAVHPSHWAVMAPAANGTASVSSDGEVCMAEAEYIESMEFYRELLNKGVAAPATDIEISAPDEFTGEWGGIYADIPYGVGDMCTAEGEGQYVMTYVEAWRMPSLEKQLGGEWGLVPFPWGSNVSCGDDYTTLSGNYGASQDSWYDVVAPKAEYRADTRGISDEMLFRIASDWCDLTNPEGAEVRHAEWKAEKDGKEYVNLGYFSDESRQKLGLCTEEDVAIYNWLHSRAAVDWGMALNSNSTVRVGKAASYVFLSNIDVRSICEHFSEEGKMNMKDKGY